MERRVSKTTIDKFGCYKETVELFCKEAGINIVPEKKIAQEDVKNAGRCVRAYTIATYGPAGREIHVILESVKNIDTKQVVFYGYNMFGERNEWTCIPFGEDEYLKLRTLRGRELITWLK